LVRDGQAEVVVRKVRLEEAPLCFPKRECNLAEALKSAGVEYVYDFGPRDLMGFSVLGVGFRGVVFLGEWEGKRVAIKVRRTDCFCDMRKEAEIQRLAWPVAPKVYKYSESFIIMEYVPYPGIESVLGAPPEELRETVIRVLKAGRELDKAGIDHGELVRPWKHVRVGETRVVILDYGSASTRRRPANVTSLVSGLLLKPSPPASAIAEKLGVDRAALLEAVRAYKRSLSDEAFEALLSLIAQ